MNKSESKYFNTAVRMNEAFLALLEKKDFAYITVKEICEKAGVNRSTFYLHYETIGDLLNETMAYINRQFDSYFANESRLDVQDIEHVEMEELYLITPQYLLPYLKFVKENRRLFKTVLERSDLFHHENTFDMIFKYVFSPIMDRYHIKDEHKEYMLYFYLNGITGVIGRWLKDDCREPIEFVFEIITQCIKKPQ